MTAPLRLLALGVLLLSAGVSVASQDVAEWKFTGGSPEPTMVADGVKASPVTDPKEARPDKGLPDYIGVSTNGQAWFDVHFLRNRFDGPQGSVAGDQYLEFTVGPQDGKTLNLSGVELTCGGNTNPGEAFRASLALAASADGFREFLGQTEFDVVQSGSLLAWVADESFSVNLEGNPAFQGLTGPVTFRVYATDNASESGKPAKQHIRIDAVRVTGELK